MVWGEGATNDKDRRETIFVLSQLSRDGIARCCRNNERAKKSHQ